MVFGVADKVAMLGVEGNPVRPFQGRGSVRLISAHRGFDRPLLEVDAPDGMVLGVDNKQSSSRGHHQTLGASERCIQRLAPVPRVSFLSGSRDAVQFVGGPVNAPDTVPFAERDPDRVLVDRK